MIYKDVDLVKLFQLMQEYDIAETTLKNGKTEVMVKRNKEPVIVNAGGGQGVDHSFAHLPVSAAVGSEAAKTGAQAGEEGAGDQADSAAFVESAGEKYYTITAPLVGTFYRSSAPEVDPFVEVGDRINAGDVVCIVEAMKSMNEIQAEVNGVVKEICIENAQLVEYEQVMFKVDTAA